MPLVRVASAEDVPVGTGRQVVANGRLLALFNVKGEFHAVDGVCPHQGGPIGEGILDGSVVSCPWHFWRYDVVKGHAPDFPQATIRKYPVQRRGAEILVEI